MRIVSKIKILQKSTANIWYNTTYVEVCLVITGYFRQIIFLMIDAFSLSIVADSMKRL